VSAKRLPYRIRRLLGPECNEAAAKYGLMLDLTGSIRYLQRRWRV